LNGTIHPNLACARSLHKSRGQVNRIANDGIFATLRRAEWPSKKWPGSQTNSRF
jgi:hypothetical protein